MPKASVLAFGVIVITYLFGVTKYGFTHSSLLRPLLVRGHRSCRRKLFHQVCKVASVVLFLCSFVVWRKGWVTLGGLFLLLEVDCVLVAVQFEKHRWKLALAEWNFVGICEESIDVIAQVARQVGFVVEIDSQGGLCQLYGPSGKIALESVSLGYARRVGFFSEQEAWVKERLKNPSFAARSEKRGWYGSARIKTLRLWSEAWPSFALDRQVKAFFVELSSLHSVETLRDNPVLRQVARQDNFEAAVSLLFCPLIFSFMFWRSCL